MNIQIDRNQITLLVLDFLNSQNYIKSLVTLESEANISLEDLPEEIQFCRDLILNGEFSTAIGFMDIFTKDENFPYNQCIYTIKKQRFLELVENNDENDIEALRELSREISEIVSKEKHQELCNFLKLTRVSDHPDYVNWDVYKGRMSCFNEIKQHLKRTLFSNNQTEREKTPKNSLFKLLSALIVQLFKHNKEDISHILNKSQEDLNLNNPDFFKIIEKTIANWKFSLISNKVDNDAIQYMSKSIDFRKNISGIQDFNKFAMQSVNFENLKSQQQQQKNAYFSNKLEEMKQSRVAPQHHQEELQVPVQKNPSIIKAQPVHTPSKSNYLGASDVGGEKSGLKESNGPRHNDLSASHGKSEMQKSRELLGQSSADYIAKSSYLNQGRSQVGESYKYDMFATMEEIGQIQDIQPIRTACFSPDGEKFAVGTNSKALKIYNMQSLFSVQERDEERQIEQIFEKNNHHYGSIYSVDWSNTGRYIATGSNDKLIKVISVPNFKTDKELMELKLSGHKGIVRSIAFTQDDTRLLSASTDHTIKIWDVKQGEEIRTLQGHENAVYCLQVSGDGNCCVSVGMDKSLKLWDLRSHECSISISTSKYSEMNYVSLKENTKNYSSVRHVEKSTYSAASGGILAAVAHIDGLVTLWDLSTRKVIEEIEVHEADCRSVEFDASAGLIASTSFDSSIAIYDLNKQTIINRIQNHTDRVVLAKWHPFYPVILSTSADSTARLFAPQRFVDNFK